MAQTTDLNHSDPRLRLVAKVRDKVGEPHVIFDDDSYLSDLEDALDNVLKAAALRLLAIANSEAYIQKVQKTLSLETNGATLADSYRASARMLLQLAGTGSTPAPLVRPPAPEGQCLMPRRVDGFSRSDDENERRYHERPYPYGR